MRSKALILPAALLVAAVMLVLARKERDLARGANLNFAQVTKERMALSGAIATATTRAADSVRLESDLRAKLAAAKPLVLRAKIGERPAAPDLPALFEKNPALRALYMKSYRWNLDPAYRAWYTKLALPPATIEKFKDLLMEREEERIDLQATMEAQGVAEDDPAILAIKKQSDENLRSAESNLLGNEGYQQLQQFQELQPLITAVVSPMAYLIPAGEAPPTAAQTTQLAEVLAKNSTPAAAGTTGLAALPAIDWPATLTQARGFLTAPQMAALTDWSKNVQVFALIRQYYQLQTATK